MVTEKEIRQINELIGNQTNFIECKRRIEEQEPQLLKWISENSKTIAIEESMKVMELSNNQSGAQLYESLVNRIRARINSCIIAGYLANEVYHGSKWNEKFGLDGTSLHDKKMSAFIQGLLDERYYKGLDTSLPLAKKALENFRKVKEERLIRKHLEKNTKVEE
jgi:hypothetical protein